jgi:DNA invertase Pin-like site-specific DNA recombinase
MPAKTQAKIERSDLWAIYVRVSSENQADTWSPGDQVQAAKEVIEADGGRWDERFIFYDRHSGDDLYERPEINRMLEYVRKGPICGVAALRSDRWTRNPAHFMALHAELDFYGVKLKFKIGGYDATPTGLLLAHVQAYSDQLDRLKFLERSERARNAKVAAQMPLGTRRRPPYGFTWREEPRDGRYKAGYQVVEREAVVVRRVFSDLAEGQSLIALANQLNREQIPSPSGVLWNRTMLRAMLRNPLYYGEAYAKRYEGKDYRDREGWVRIPAADPEPIVSRELFEAANRAVEANRTRSHYRADLDPENYMQGFVTCAGCGGPMYVLKCGQTGTYYQCRRNVTTSWRAHERGLTAGQALAEDPERPWCPAPAAMSAPKLHALVWERVVRMFERPDAEIIAAIAGSVDEELDTDRDHRKANVMALGKVERKLEKVIRRLLDESDDFTLGLLEREKAELTEARRLLLAEQEVLRRRGEQRDESTRQARAFIDRLATIRARVRDATPDDKRDVATALRLRATWSACRWRAASGT